MEALQKARQLYGKIYTVQGSALPVDSKIADIENMKRLVLIAIREVPPPSLFKTPDLFGVFEKAVIAQSKLSPDLSDATKAFESLEKYFLQLVEQPWKREFKKIKLYGGYFRTRIKSILHEAEFIFFRAGYRSSADELFLVLDGRNMPSAAHLLDLAFDCRLCYYQCHAIAEHYEVVKSLSLSLEQAISEVLYSDRSRGRPLPQPHPLAQLNNNSTTAYVNNYCGHAMLQNAVQQPQQPLQNVPVLPLGQTVYDGASSVDLSASKSTLGLMPTLPKREPVDGEGRLPLQVSSNLAMARSSDYQTAPTTVMNNAASGSAVSVRTGTGSMLLQDQVNAMKLLPSPGQGEHFEGTMDEHIIRSLQTVVGPERNVQVPTDFQMPVNIHDAQYRNGRKSHEDIAHYHQLQQLKQEREMQQRRFTQPTRNYVHVSGNNYLDSSTPGPLEVSDPACFPFHSSHSDGKHTLHSGPAVAVSKTGRIATGTTDSFYDEGIEGDFSPPVIHSTTSANNQQQFSLAGSTRLPATSNSNAILPSKHSIPSMHQSLMMDHGYITAPQVGSNGHPQYLKPHQPVVSSSIYVEGGGAKIVPQGPPPIPPRSLKPTDLGDRHHAEFDNHSNFLTNSSYAATAGSGSAYLPDMRPGLGRSLASPLPLSMDSAKSSHGSMRTNGVPRSSALLQARSPSVGHPPFPVSAAGPAALSPTAQPSASGPVLRRDRRHLGAVKSSSLKYPSANEGNNHLVVSHSRAARSMDLSRTIEWACYRCTALNSPSDKICCICSASRAESVNNGGGVVSPLTVSSKTGFMDEPMPGDSKKPCPTCTFENEPSKSNCEMCEAKLADPFTYV